MTDARRSRLPALPTVLLGVVLLMTVATYALTFGRLNRVANLASVSITGWSYSEFIRQVAEVQVLVANGATPAALETPLAILQSKALIVTGEPLTATLDAQARITLTRTVRNVETLTPQSLVGPQGKDTLERVMAGAQTGYTSAVATLGRQRSSIAADLRTAEWALSILALLLAGVSTVMVRQILRGSAHALQLEVTRSTEAERARAQLEHAASELRTAERNVQRERDFALQVMGAMGEGLFVTDEHDRFAYVNPTFARTVGRDAATLVGQPARDALQLPEPLNAGRERMTLEHPLPLPGGRVMPTLMTLASREVGGVIAVITDLTETKRSEERLRSLYDVTSGPDEDLQETVCRLLRVGHEAFASASGAYVRWLDGQPHAECQVGVADVERPSIYHCGEQARERCQECRSDDAMAVPVSAQGELHGVLVFHRAAAGPAFTSADEEFLKLIGQMLEHLVDRRHAYELLRLSEARNVAIIRSSLDAIITSDAEGQVTEFNPAAEHMFGVSREQAIGQSMAGLIIPEHMRDAHQQGMKRILATGEARILGKRLELTALRGNGQEFPVELSVVRLPTQPSVYAGFIRDITDRKAAEERLQERTTQLNSVFNVSPDGFVTFGANGRIIDVNPAFLSLTGTAQGDVLALDEPAFERLLSRLCERSGAGRLNHGNAEVLQLVWPAKRVLKRTVRPMTTPAGDQLGQVMYFRDITHEAEISNMKSEFMSTAAHELRTPMTSIYGFAELLLTRQLDAETTRDLLETIYRQAGRLILLLTELLDLARIEARAGKDFTITEQELLPLIDGAVEAFTPAGQRDRVKVQVPGHLPAIPVDGSKFHQALGNVISNAFKYSPAGGEVQISAWQDPLHSGLLHVSVTDHGIGMNRDQSHKAFERFYRADNSGSIPGTGLGLSLVQEIMQCHGGRASLQSEPGQGTVVTLTFPLVSPVPPQGMTEHA